MQFSETWRKFRDLSSLNERFRNKIDEVLDSVLDLVKRELTTSEQSHPILSKALFCETLEEWCQRHPETSARLISLRPWDDSSREADAFDFGNASKREILQVVRSQFGDSLLMSQLSRDVFVILITEDQDCYVENDFNFINKLQGLKTRLSAAVSLSFHVESAKWPRDASTPVSFLDQATPPDTNIGGFPLEKTTSDLEETLESVLEVDLRKRVEESLPESLRDKVPINRILN